VAQADSPEPPTASARFRSLVKVYGILGGQSLTGAGFLRALQFPLPVIIPPTAPHSLSSSGAGTIDPLVADVPSAPSVTAAHE
jgi:hypothetical protein